jgi:hypothetical protein
MQQAALLGDAGHFGAGRDVQFRQYLIDVLLHGAGTDGGPAAAIDPKNAQQALRGRSQAPIYTIEARGKSHQKSPAHRQDCRCRDMCTFLVERRLMHLGNMN